MISTKRKIYNYFLRHTFLPSENMRDIDVIFMLYGLGGIRAKTLGEVARKFKLSKESIKRIENKFLKKII